MSQHIDLDYRVIPNPPQSDADRRRQILEGKIESGRASAARVIETVQRDVPKDQIARSSALTFAPAPGMSQSGTGLGSRAIVVHAGGDVLAPNPHALGQIAERAGVPTAYLRELAGGEAAWQQELAAHALNEHFKHQQGRVLLRSVRGQLRGVLSDKYRRLDSRPLIDALAAEAQKIGAVPVDGSATETRTAIKLIHPRIIEVAGDFVAIGGEWCTSDYGNGKHAFRAFLLRVLCLNGATGEDLMSQVHLGARLAEDIEFSERTYRLDTATSVSQLRDVVRHAFSPAGEEKLTSKIRKANGQDYTAKQLEAAVKGFGKETTKAVVDAFKSPDIINLPAGETAWRASNAISWIAKNTKDDEVRLDLERAAGALV